VLTAEQMEKFKQFEAEHRHHHPQGDAPASASPVKQTSCWRSMHTVQSVPYSQATAHFAVGMMNSAPFAVLSGQRCMIDFCRV
jgi:hypothetical protein